MPTPIQSLPPTTILTKENTGEYVGDPNEATPGSILDSAAKGVVFIQETGGSTIRWYKNADGTWKRESEAQSITAGENVDISDDGNGNFTISADVPIQSISGSGEVTVIEPTPGNFQISSPTSVKGLTAGTNITIDDLGSGNYRINSDVVATVLDLVEGNYININETSPGIYEIAAAPPVETLVEGNSISINETPPGSGTFEIAVSGDLLIPDATPSVSGKVNITTQEFGGAKTFRGDVTVRADETSGGVTFSYSGPGNIFLSGETTLTDSEASTITDYTLTSQVTEDAPAIATDPKNILNFRSYLDKGTGVTTKSINDKFGVAREYDISTEQYVVRQTLEVDTSLSSEDFNYNPTDPGTPFVWARCDSISTGGIINNGSPATLRAIYGTAANNVFAVGDYGKVMKWNGSAWSSVYSATTTNFSAIWAYNASNIWIFGEGSSVIQGDGASWTYGLTGYSGDIKGAWGTLSTYFVYTSDIGEIVKGSGSGGPPGNYTQQVSGVTSSLNAVWGTSTTNVWAVGDGGTILNWNGASWSTVASGTTNDLYGIWGSGASDIWAVGEGGIVLNWNGASWSTVTSGTTNLLRGVWGSGASSVWAVGDYGKIIKWDGASWSSATSNTGITLNAVWGTSSSNVWAVGEGGIIVRWNGSVWAIVDNGMSSLKFVPYSSSGSWDFTQWNYSNVSVPSIYSDYSNSLCLCPETLVIANPSYDPLNPNDGSDPTYINTYRDINGNYKNTPLRTWGYGNLGAEYMGGCYLDNGTLGLSNWSNYYVPNGFTVSFWLKPYTPSGQVPSVRSPIFWHSFNNTKQGVDRYVWGDDITQIPYGMVNYWPDDYTGMTSWGIFYTSTGLQFQYLTEQKNVVNIIDLVDDEWNFICLCTNDAGTYFWDMNTMSWICIALASTSSILWDNSGRWTIGPPPTNPGTVSPTNYGRKLRNYDDSGYMSNTNSTFNTGNPDFGATPWPKVLISDIRVYDRELTQSEISFLSGKYTATDVSVVERDVSITSTTTTLQGDLIVKDPLGTNPDITIGYADFRKLYNYSPSTDSSSILYPIANSSGISRVYGLEGSLKIGRSDDTFDYTKALTVDGTSDFNGIVNVNGSSNYLYVAGSVGVGTSSTPLGQLQINKSNAGGLGGEVWVTNSATATLNNAAAISFGVDSSVSASRVAARIKAVMTNASTKDSKLVFSLYSSSGGSVIDYITLTSSGILSIGGDGNAGAPVLSFGSTADSDTGIFHPTGNTLAISTGGTERLRIDSSGNVGIGTTSPDFKLDVSGSVRIEGDDGSNRLRFGGTGAGDADVNLYKSAANTLKTDNDFVSADITTGTVTISGSTASRWRGALAAAPGSGNVAGDLYYDTVLLKLYVYDGSNWQAVA